MVKDKVRKAIEKLVKQGFLAKETCRTCAPPSGRTCDPCCESCNVGQ